MVSNNPTVHLPREDWRGISSTTHGALCYSLGASNAEKCDFTQDPLAATRATGVGYRRFGMQVCVQQTVAPERAHTPMKGTHDTGGSATLLRMGRTHATWVLS